MQTNPYAPPTAPVADLNTEFEYAGFWIRLAASVIDSVLILAITFPLLYSFYGSAYFTAESGSFIEGPTDFIISYIAPAIVTVLFWLKKQATPGKMALSLKIVDATTGNALSVRQSIIRYLGYYLSMLGLFLGFIWVGIDARKQGWHDKLAGAVVIRSKSSTTKPVTFEKS